MLILDANKIKSYLGIHSNESDTQIEVLILPTVKFIEGETGRVLNNGDDSKFDIDEGLAIIIAKFIEYFMKDAGIKSYALSRETTTFSDTIPVYLLSMLKPYVLKEIEPDRTVKFYSL
ncbi:MAG: phage head-tail connector protein [Erysipelotrichaceae bacterium]